MKMRKINILLMACLALSAGAVQSMAAQETVAKPAIAQQVAKMVAPVMTINKGAGNENLVIKQLSVGDINNVWCVANDGKADAVYQLTETGLVRRADGNFVSVGKEVVSVLNDQHQLLHLEGGNGTNFVPVEQAPALVHVSRPIDEIGWGINVNGQLVEYDHDDKSWEVVQTIAGQPATGFVSVDANAEGVVYVVNAQGEMLKFDAARKELTKRAMEIHAADKKAGKHGKHGKKAAAQQPAVAEQIASVAVEAVAPVAAAVVAEQAPTEQAAPAHKMTKKEKKAAAKAEKKAAKKAAKQAAHEPAAPAEHEASVVVDAVVAPIVAEQAVPAHELTKKEKKAAAKAEKKAAKKVAKQAATQEVASAEQVVGQPLAVAQEVAVPVEASAKKMSKKAKKAAKKAAKADKAATEEVVAPVEQPMAIAPEAATPVEAPAKKVAKKEKKAKKVAKAKKIAKADKAVTGDEPAQTDQQAAQEAAAVLQGLIQKSEASDGAQPAAPAKKKKVKKAKKAQQVEVAAEQVVQEQQPMTLF